MEKETEERRKCPGCYGNGWILVEGYPDPETEECPVCKGQTSIPAALVKKIYTFYNLRRSRLIAELKNPSPTGITSLSFPEDYAVHAMIEADSLSEAATVAANRGVVLSTYTVVEQPSGALVAQPGVINCLVH